MVDLCTRRIAWFSESNSSATSSLGGYFHSQGPLMVIVPTMFSSNPAEDDLRMKLCCALKLLCSTSGTRCTQSRASSSWAEPHDEARAGRLIFILSGAHRLQKEHKHERRTSISYVVAHLRSLSPAHRRTLSPGRQRQRSILSSKNAFK